MKFLLILLWLVSSVSYVYANVDLDGDGVINELDYCENTEMNVIVDSTGCEPDDDHDGVINRLDKCPDTPLGVKVDENGCPPVVAKEEPIAPLVTKTDSNGRAVELEIRTGFKFDSYELSEKGLEDVDAFYDYMQKYPEANVMIVGHTCNMGPEEYNVQLSQNRANAFSQALQEKGMSPQRISAKGEGMALPVTSNDTKEDRALNRRVEIKIFYPPEDAEQETPLP